MVKVVVNLKVAQKGKDGNILDVCTCNMIENLDTTFGRLRNRLVDLDARRAQRIGDITINFVEEDE